MNAPALVAAEPTNADILAALHEIVQLSAAHVGGAVHNA